MQTGTKTHAASKLYNLFWERINISIYKEKKTHTLQFLAMCHETFTYQSLKIHFKQFTDTKGYLYDFKLKK